MKIHLPETRFTEWTLAGGFLLGVVAVAAWGFDAGYKAVLNAHLGRPNAAGPATDCELDGQPWQNPDVFGYAADTFLTGYLERPLDLDQDPVKNRIPQLDPGMYADTTNIGGGMRVGIEGLLNNPREDEEDVERIMILMTDGHANVAEAPSTDPKGSIEYYAALALAQGIIIHGVTLGSEADGQSIEAAATLTGGIYRHVPEENLEEMLEAFKEIGLNGGRAKLVQ